MKYSLLMVCFIAVFSSCKNEPKPTESVINQQQYIAQNFLANGEVKVTLPGLMGNTSTIDTTELYLGRPMLTGPFEYIEDQGTLYIDIDSSKVILNVTDDTSKIYFVAPMYIQPKSRKEIMSFISYFIFDTNSKTVTQLEGGEYLIKNSKNIVLTSGEQAVKLTYTIDEQNIAERRFFANEKGLTQDFVFGINHFLEKGYFFFAEEQQSDTTNSLEYNYGSFDIDADGREELLVLFQSSDYCGSAGCNLLVLDDNYSLISELTSCMYPIVVMETATLGYNDLGVFSDNENRQLKYDGVGYPENPSLSPALNPSKVLKTIIEGGDNDHAGKYN